MKVLIVEDEGLISQMYMKKLENGGYEVLTAGDGDEGLATATAELPDIILSDIMMPQTDGLAMLKSLKENHATKEIPVVMLTNLSKDSYINEAIELGAVSYIVKSQTLPGEVIKKIEEILEASGKQILSK